MNDERRDPNTSEAPDRPQHEWHPTIGPANGLKPDVREVILAHDRGGMTTKEIVAEVERYLGAGLTEGQVAKVTAAQKEATDDRCSRCARLRFSRRIMCPNCQGMRVEPGSPEPTLENFETIRCAVCSGTSEVDSGDADDFCVEVDLRQAPEILDAHRDLPQILIGEDVDANIRIAVGFASACWIREDSNVTWGELVFDTYAATRISNELRAYFRLRPQQINIVIDGEAVAQAIRASFERGGLDDLAEAIARRLPATERIGR